MIHYLTYLLTQADRRASASLEGIVREEGITIEQWRILRVLSDGSGWTMGDLAEAALLTLPTLTRVADRMVGQAFIYRATDPADRRKVVIYLSEKGRTVGSRLNGLVLGQQNKLFAALGPQKADQLMSLLQDLNAAVAVANPMTDDDPAAGIGHEKVLPSEPSLRPAAADQLVRSNSLT